MKHLLAVTACAALLGACSVTKPPADVAVALPASWYAPPLAHAGSTQALTHWWSRFDDPVLTDWINRAQAQSPTIAAARAQVFAARATRFGVEAQNGPQVNAVANASRGITDPTIPLGTSLSAGLQASWAIGLWGESTARLGSTQAQQDAAGAGWHEARVLVAAETAQLYFGQRLCQAGRGDTGALGEQLVARGEIEAACANVAARRGHEVCGGDLPRLGHGVLLQQYAVSPLGDNRAGRDPHARAGGKNIAVRRARAALAHERPRAFPARERKPVHRRKVGGGLGARGKEILGQITAKCLSGRDGLGRQQRREGEQAGLRFLEAERRAQSSAFQSPDLPPVLAIRRTSEITMPLSIAFAMS